MAATPRRSRTRALIALNLASFEWSVGLGAATPFIPILSHTFRQSFAAAGFVTAAGGMGRLFISYFAGHLMDKFGKRRVALVGIFIRMIFSFMEGLSRSYPQLVIYRLMSGVGTAIWGIGLSAMTADIAKRTEELKGSIAANFKKITVEALKLATGFTGLAAFTKTTDQRVRDLDADNDAAKAARAATEKALVEARTVLARMTKDIAEAEENLASLSEGTQEKLLAANADTVARLDKLRDDGAAFRAELKKSLSLSVGELKELEGMSVNEIMAILGLGGAAAGIGVAGGRTGKSRSHQEVEKVKATIAKLLADVERQKQPRAEERRSLLSLRSVSRVLHGLACVSR